ncbi:hypothetical protein LWC35_01185 [Pseudonocardia kujensis]|uniref:hypothetical protein n=1 Tax=Pseudonocardia kujensis TaxID=1128675 RepID=UPI001E4D4237|nr:hypothetical protein [Pseudonocardia kujensis]MCE0761535.1 hypothetical protein [Pseudonocardia kujensis]
MAQQHPRPQTPRYPQAGSGQNGRPVPPQAGPPDLPRTGAAQRPGAGRPDDRRPGHPGPQRRSASGGATGSRGSGGTGGPAGAGATRRVGPPSGGLPTQVTTTTGPQPRMPSDGLPTTARPTTEAATAATTATVEEKKPDLTVNKILAGAGAAATTAVFGSFFGASGTVAGAALGSVVTTLGTTLYQRSLDRTKETVLARVKIPGRTDAVVIAEPVDPLATIPLQRRADEGAGPTMLQPALAEGLARGAEEQTRPWYTRKRLLLGAASAVVAFVVGMLVITGVEWIKGSPISGGTSGTSVSRVVNGTSTTPDEGTDKGGSTDTTETATPTTTPEPTGERSGSTERTGSDEPSGSATATTTPRTGTPTRTTAPNPGDTGSGSQRGGVDGLLNGGNDNGGSGTGGSSSGGGNNAG